MVNALAIGQSNEVNTCNRYTRNGDLTCRELLFVSYSAGSGDNLNLGIAELTQNTYGLAYGYRVRRNNKIGRAHV